MTEASSDSDYHSENDKVSELEILRETLNNHNIEWPEMVDEKECSSVRSTCYLASIPECREESNGNDQNSVDAGERNIIKETDIKQAKKSKSATR